LVRRQEADHPICLSRDQSSKHANRVIKLLRVEIEARLEHALRNHLGVATLERRPTSVKSDI
jgi:hypothetical protein